MSDLKQQFLAKMATMVVSLHGGLTSGTIQIDTNEATVGQGAILCTVSCKNPQTAKLVPANTDSAEFTQKEIGLVLTSKSFSLMVVGTKSLMPHHRYSWNWHTQPEHIVTPDKIGLYEPPAGSVPTSNGCRGWKWEKPPGVTSFTAIRRDLDGYLQKTNGIITVTSGGHEYPLEVLKQTTIDTMNEYWLSSKHPELGWQKK